MDFVAEKRSWFCWLLATEQKAKTLRASGTPLKPPSNENTTVLSNCSVPITLKQCLGVCIVCRVRYSRIGTALKCESLSNISHKTPTTEAQLLAFIIFTAVRKHSGQPYLPRAMHFGVLKFLSITGDRCWVAYMPYRIFVNKRRGVSKFVDRKELHFKQKVNCGSQCGVVTDCFGSYCILLVFVNYSDFVPQGNIMIFPSKLGSSCNITLGMPFILWLPMMQISILRMYILTTLVYYVCTGC